jgi:hypothetical protein
MGLVCIRADPAQMQTTPARRSRPVAEISLRRPPVCTEEVIE